MPVSQFMSFIRECSLICIVSAALIFPGTAAAQQGIFFNERDDQYLLLGLKRAKVSFEVARAQYERQQEQEEQAALLASQRQGGGAVGSFAGSGNQAIDSSDMPQFIATQESLAEVAQASLLDFGLLSIFTFLAFAGAFFAFVRYDVR
ncbi:MAG: hypothetical protein CMQ15_11140 [Gammaproteobacteria bacterium]|nr:hypothetical protein [Gammaproteobacteria bacterium]